MGEKDHGGCRRKGFSLPSLSRGLVVGQKLKGKGTHRGCYIIGKVVWYRPSS